MTKRFVEDKKCTPPFWLTSQQQPSTGWLHAEARSFMQVHISLRSGFTLVELMIVVAIIGLLAGISTPSVLKARETSQLNAIINNLRVIENAKDQWAIEAKQGAGSQPLDTEIAPYMSTRSMPTPVVSEIYNINPVGTTATATLVSSLGALHPGDLVTLP
jgi:prepilin-type N-terminal cleavage/methylation domain-containing protein